MQKKSLKLLYLLFLSFMLIGCNIQKDEYQEAGNILRKEDLKGYCEAKYPSSTKWKQTSNLFSVEDIYGGIPQEQSSRSETLKKARTELGINHYGGCGPIALIGQLDFLARFANYPIISYWNTLEGQIDLARRVFYKTPTIELVTGDVFTFPNAFIESAYEIMKDLNINKQFKISQYSFLSSKYQKVNKIKESINKGMPVILWTLGEDMGDFHDHYMNIYAYEEWQGIDSNGKIQTCTFFELRMNRTKEFQVLMDSDLLSGKCGIIVFEEVYDNISIKPVDFGSIKNNIEEESLLITSKINNEEIKVDSKILGVESNNQFLVMNANVSYIDFEISKPIFGMNIEVLLQSYDQKENENSTLKLEYKNSNNNWVEIIDFIKEDMIRKDNCINNPIFYFDEPITKFRLYYCNFKAKNLNNVVYIGNLNLYTGSHQHNFAYKQDTSMHEIICNDCKFINFEPHTYTNGKCKECGYINPNHIHNNYYLLYDAINHQEICTVCNNISLNKHNFIKKNQMIFCIDCTFSRINPFYIPFSKSIGFLYDQYNTDE